MTATMTRPAPVNTVEIDAEVGATIGRHAAPYAVMCANGEYAEHVLSTLADGGVVDIDLVHAGISLMADIVARLTPQISVDYWSKMGDEYAQVIASARLADHDAVLAAGIALMSI